MSTLFGGKKGIFSMLIVFLIGWLAHAVVSDLDSGVAKPQSFDVFEVENDFGSEKNGPSDHISEKQIHVYKDRIVLDIENAAWARFTDTNSMDPVIDQGSNSIELKPTSTSDVGLGDIISYHSEYAEGLIIHRVVEVGEDASGWYVRVKGDNLENVDPGRIRLSQIEGVVVGIIY
jgi:hypothetical protein